MRYLAACVVITSGLLAGTAAQAEVIELEGTVKSIDVDARTITIERKTAKGTKTVDLEVAKQAGDLVAVKAGQTITLRYDPALELVTQLGNTTTTATAAEPEAVALKELRKAYNSAPWVSADGLRLYWTSTDVGGAGNADRWIWQASRKSVDSLWDDQQRVVPGTDCSLTQDELLLFVAEGDTIRVSSRANREAAFSRPNPVTELKPLGKIGRPSVSSDGLMLWFQEAGPNGRMLRVTRGSRSEPWIKPQPVSKTEIGPVIGFSIYPDRGFGVFSLRTPASTNSRLCIARTQDQGVSFGRPQTIVVPNGPDGKQPYFVEATQELFYAGMPGQDKSAQIYSVRGLTLPSTLK